MNWPGIAIAIIALLVLIAWDTVCYAWVHERQKRARARQMRSSLALRRRIVRLEYRVEALAAATRTPTSNRVDDEPATDEFPAVQPDTEPMPLIVDPTPAVQARRDAAWDEQRPSPVARGKSAEWVEEAIKGFNFSGRDR